MNQQTALDFVLAGATAIGVGTDLIPIEAIERRQADRIRELALRFAGYVKEGRARLESAKPSAEIRFLRRLKPATGNETHPSGWRGNQFGNHQVRIGPKRYGFQRPKRLP